MQEVRDVEFDSVPWGIVRRLGRRFLPFGALTLAGIALVVTRWPWVVNVDVTAYGLVAVGLNAIGVVALGGVNALGIVVVGGVNALGLVALGGVNSVGLVAIGGCNSGGVIAIGGRNSAGFIAVGHRAYGFYVVGRFTGRGSYVLSADRQDWSGMVLRAMVSQRFWNDTHAMGEVTLRLLRLLRRVAQR